MELNICLYRKLSYCHTENNEFQEAYECLQKALEDSPNAVGAEDYLLLFKYAVKTHQTLDETSKDNICCGCYFTLFI